MVVPIVLSLLIFFSALSWATDTVNRTNERVDTTLALLRVADAFTQWGVITKDTWEESCEAIRTKEQDVGFVVCLVDPGDVSDVLNRMRSSSGGIDTSACDSLTSPCAYTEYLPRKASYFLVRYFPVTYQNDNGSTVENQVKFLVVAVWPRA